jgi:hypothetical protein
MDLMPYCGVYSSLAKREYAGESSHHAALVDEDAAVG